MDLPLPAEVQGQLERYQAVLAALEERLKPLLRMSYQQVNELEPLERATVLATLAQAVNALYRLHLKAMGTNPADHAEAKKEEERLQQYVKKVRKVAAEQELRTSRRSLEVNVAAVNRFINHAVPDLSGEQRDALREGAQRPRGEGGARGAAGQRQASSRDAALSFLDEVMADVGGGAGPGAP